MHDLSFNKIIHCHGITVRCTLMNKQIRNPRSMNRAAQRYLDKVLMTKFLNIIRFCLKFAHRKRACQCISRLSSFLVQHPNNKHKQKKIMPNKPIVYERSKKSPSKGRKVSRPHEPINHAARTVVEELLNRYDPSQLQNINSLLHKYKVRMRMCISLCNRHVAHYMPYVDSVYLTYHIYACMCIFAAVCICLCMCIPVTVDMNKSLLMCTHTYQGRELDLIDLIGNRFADGKPALSTPATWLFNFLKRTMGDPDAAAAIPPLVSSPATSPSASSTRSVHTHQQTVSSRGQQLLPWA